MSERKDYSVWPGTEQERFNFLEAIARQCSCTVENDVITEICRPHLLLTPNKENYEYWEHLVYGKRLWENHGKQIRLEEFDSTRKHNLPGMREKLPPYKTRWSS